MDFNKHRVAIAGAVLVALVGTLVFLEKQRSAEYATGDDTAESPLPTIVRDQITSVEITRPGQAPVRLDKRGDRFVVASPVEAPADASNVSAMLDKLVELEFASIASTSRSSHAQLEVDDAHAIHVVVKAGSRTAADLRIGVYRGSNTMIRIGNGNDVVAVHGSIRFAFGRELREWRDRVITDVTPGDVKWVSFASPEGTFRFDRDAAGTFAPVAGQRPIEGFDATRVDALVTSLARLRASDFGDAAVAASAFAAPRGTVTLHVETAAGGDAGAARSEDVVLVLGAAHGETGDAYVQRSGNATPFVVASGSVEKLHPAPAAFVAPPPGEAPAAPPEGMQMPQGMDGNQIPPELLQQLMQQAGARGAQGH